MRSIFTSAFVFAVSASAYQILTPNESQGWVVQSGTPSMTVTWQRVNTDPLNFTAVLTNQQNPSLMPVGVTNQILAAQIDGTLGRTALGAPSGGWPIGRGFRLNFCQDPQNLNTILAQSGVFAISGPNISSTIVPTMSVPAGVTTVAGIPATTPAAGPANPSSGSTPVGSNPPANGASSANNMHVGLLGLLMLLGIAAA